MNKLCPFTRNQTEWFLRSLTSWFNLLEGGKRAGKNIIEIQSFCSQLEEHPNRIHLVAGVSIATAKLNVLDCDGYGMLNYFEGRCKEGKYQDRSCLYIQTKTGEKIVLISGGGKANDYKLIKGNTYGMALITEANECHKTFIAEVFDRTLSSKNRKIFHDINPKPPKHHYYTDVEEFHKNQQKKNPLYGFNYGHLTILDNMSIDDDQLKAILNTYDKTTVWFKRDIKGLRIMAEGAIYSTFIANKGFHVLKELPKSSSGFITIGVDFGGSKSKHAFNATLIDLSNRRIITIKDYWKVKINDEIMNTGQLESEFVKFVREVQRDFSQFSIATIHADSAEQVLIAGLQSALIKEGLGYKVSDAIKGVINERIRLYNKMLGAGVYFVLKSCEHTIDALENAVWKDTDGTVDERLDDGTSNIDTLDAQEYSTEKFAKAIETITNYGG